MFGEKTLVGLKKTKISDTRLLTLPKFTNADYNENLIFYCLENDIRLYSEQTISKKATHLFESLKAKLTPNEYNAYRRFFFAILLSEEKVNKKGKIMIPPKVREHLNSEIYIRGCFDHIKLFNSLEEVKKYELTLK